MTFISYAQNFEDVMLWRALGYVGQGFYIDVGANAPEADSVTKAFYDRGWSGINIEPLAEHIAELRANRPRDINLQVAMGSEAGEITLYAPDKRGWATVATDMAKRHARQGIAMSTTSVPLVRLDTVCQQYAPADIHFLKIDVEGYEKEVLDGMDFSRFRPWIVVVEAIMPHQHGSHDEAWEAILLNNRYQAVYFDGLNRFYLAEEHNALAAAFCAPPNVFDDFTRLETVQAKKALVTLQAQLAAMQAQLAAMQAQVAHFEAVADQARAELDALRCSRSWRLTGPIRWAGERARQVKHALTTKSVPQSAIAKTAPERAPANIVRRNISLQAVSLYRPLEVPESLRLPSTDPNHFPAWFRLTGHAEGHYSLAVVNRGLLHGLSQTHPGRVVLQPRDGESTTLSPQAPEWLKAFAAKKIPEEAIRNTCAIVHHYPPISDPLPATLRLALFFWEETAVPAAMIAHLEAHFDAVLVASRFVKRAVRNSGCTLPVAVIPMGVDHLDMQTTAWQPPTSEEICRFFHLSSAFERKGPDLLLKAWLAQFSRDDPVELYIKAFPNPHNHIHALWAELSAQHPRPPRVIIDENPLDDKQLRALYASAHAMVLPTRGEGFNLPAAEALALGTPLLVTGHGGQTDFCNLDTAALIPFLFAKSGSHLKTTESCWVEPDIKSLGEQLQTLHREIRTNATTLQRRRAAGMAHVRQTYTWFRSADAIHRFASILDQLPGRSDRVSLHLLSPWNTACGIAEYTRGLISAFRPEKFAIHVDCDTRTPAPESEVAGAPSYAPTWELANTPSVVRSLQQIARRAKPGDIVLVQHQPSLFRLDTPVCEELRLLSQQGLTVLLEMHATRPLLDHLHPSAEAVAALRALDRIVVHHVDDLNQLLTLGVDANLMLLPHGIPDLLPANATASRASLGLPDDALILASFGFLHPHKGVDQIIASLPAIARHTGRRACLLAVNALPDPENQQLWEQYQHLADVLGVAENVRWITGFQDIQQSLQQLACADFILFPYANTQESASGAVTIGLSTGKPVLVSNQPLFAELAEIAWQMPGHDATAITEAICTLNANPEQSQALLARQREWLQARSWTNISARLANTLLGCRCDKALSALLSAETEPSNTLARPPQLLVDVSELYHRDARTGIQRVVRNILQELQRNALLPHLARYQILPVFGTPGSGYCHTRKLDPAEIRKENFPEENAPVQPEAGDIFLGLDLSAHLFPQCEDWLRDYRRRGAAIYFVVYDIIPLRNPQWTVPGMQAAFNHWLLGVARQSDRLLCISASVAKEVHDWLIEHAPEQAIPEITHFPLGADILPPATAPTPASASPLPDLQGRPTFLSVGTIEPRKGQAQILAACEQLWSEGQDIILVFVGKPGWMMDAFIDQLVQHAENGRRLFWLRGLDDAALETVYAQSSVLIAASEAEGFGLPIVEAARHHLPVIARDIPVFREVAGQHAFYFDSSSPDGLARAIQYWLTLWRHGQHPVTDGMCFSTWQQAARHLQQTLLT